MRYFTNQAGLFVFQPVVLQELLYQEYVSFDLFNEAGQRVLQAGQSLARLSPGNNPTDLLARQTFYRKAPQHEVKHEGRLYAVPNADLTLQERKRHQKDWGSNHLLTPQGQGLILNSMAHFWQRLWEGKPADMALLELAADTMVAEITTQVEQVQYLSQIRVRDPYTYDHIMDVAAMSTALATHLGFDKTAIKEVSLAAILHDLGKLRIPKEIMFKPGRLTETEFNVMKLHPEIGYNILRYELKLPDAICLPALEHQEMWGGGGYPLNIKGNQIHLYSQIVKIADVYDALTSRRPYKDAIPQQKALDIMVAEGDKGFNPALLEAFCKLANYQPSAQSEDSLQADPRYEKKRA